MKAKNSLRTYSVLLLYPDYIEHSADVPETFWDFVRAKNLKNAIKRARKHVIARNNLSGICRLREFEPLLVIEGHHPDLLSAVKPHWKAYAEEQAVGI